MLNIFGENKRLSAETARLTGELEAAAGTLAQSREETRLATENAAEIQGRLATVEKSLGDAQALSQQQAARIAELEAAATGQEAAIEQKIEEAASEKAIEQIAAAGVPIIAKLPEGGPAQEGPQNITEFNQKYTELQGEAAMAYFAKYSDKFLSREPKARKARK